MIQEIPKEFWHATKLHTVAVLLSSLFSKKVKSSSIIQRRDRDLFKLLSQNKIYTMHSHIGGIHTNGPTLSNTTTHYILHTPTIYSVPQGTLLQLFLFLSRVRKLRKLFLKTFQINFPRQTFRLGLEYSEEAGRMVQEF